MATALQSQLDLLNGLYKWADFEDEQKRSPHRDRLAEPIRLEQALPDILNGIQGKRQVSLRVKHLAVAPGVVAGGVDHMPGTGNTDLALADVLHGSTGLHGEQAAVRLADLDASLAYLSMTGVVSDCNEATGDLTIEELDAGVLQTDVPRRRIIDLFPAADLARAPGSDPRVIKPFGVMRQVLLTCLSADRKDFGAVVSPGTGTITWFTIYRNKAVVPFADYSVVSLGSGLQIIRFVRAQADDAEIRADLTTTEFFNQAHAGLWLLADPVDGLGQLVSASSFSTAVAVFQVLSYTVQHGIGPEPIRAETVLNDLLVRGSMLSRNANNEYTWTVDQASLHTAVTYQGMPYQLGRGDGRWENIARVQSSRQKRIEERVNDYTMQGLYTAGFGSEAYLIQARTKRNAKGTEKTTQNKYIGDLATLQKEVGYRMRRLAASEYSLELETSSEARVISLNQVVPVTIPYNRIGPGNPPFPLMVTRIRGSRGNWTFDLTGYDATQYTAAAENLWAAAAALVVTDFTFTFPTAPTGFALVGVDVVGIGDQGKSKTYRKVQATAPPTNVTHLVWRLVRSGESIPLRDLELPALPSQTVLAEIEADSGLDYTIECFARNKNNDPEFQDGAIVQIFGYHASGDPAVPPQVAGLVVVASEYKSLAIGWNDVGLGSLLRNYEVQMSLNAGFTAIVKESSPASRNIAVNGLANGTTYFIRVRAVNRSGTPGPYSATGSGTTLLIASPDIGGSQITGFHVAAGTINGVHLAASTINQVNMNANSIGEINITANSISTIKIQGDAVTTDKRQPVVTLTGTYDIPPGGTRQVNLTHALGRIPLVTIDTNNSAVIGSPFTLTSTQIFVTLLNTILPPSVNQTGTVEVFFW